ncbi:MAG: DUF554 domain-containing protein [Spirochaetota bacterium]
MIGTLVNIAAIITGTAIGLVLRSRLPETLVRTVFQAIGLFTLTLGFMMALKMENLLIVIFSLVLGAIIGQTIDLESRMERFGNSLRQRFSVGTERFSEGMLSAFLLFCMGSMTILGAFDEGLKGDPTLLLTKSVMDGFASIALSSALGIGVGFSVIPLLLYQGGLTLLSGLIGRFVGASVISELTAVGGILLVGLGIEILEIKKIRVFNILPAIVLVVLFMWLKTQLLPLWETMR